MILLHENFGDGGTLTADVESCAGIGNAYALKGVVFGFGIGGFGGYVFHSRSIIAFHAVDAAGGEDEVVGLVALA